MTDEELILYLDRQSQLQHKATREMLIEAGRADLAEDLDRRMREIRLGITQAAAIWHSISKTQQIVLEKMALGAYLTRSVGSDTQYDAIGRVPMVLKICRITTARSLSARNLIHVNGTVTDPEAEFVITEHGKFVFAKGRAND